MPAFRSSIILLDEAMTKYNTVRNALIRDRATRTLKLWDEVGRLMLDMRQTLINEQGLGVVSETKDGNRILSKLDSIILAAKEKYARQTTRTSTLSLLINEIWNAKSIEEVQLIANNNNLSTENLKKIIDKRPSKFPPYVQQPQVVSKPVIIDETEEEQNDDDNSRHIPSTDEELMKLLNG